MTAHDPLDPQLIKRMAADERLGAAAREFFLRSCEYRYSYNFTWLGRPVIQYPQDLVALQEIIWRTRPEAIVETGVAHGGGTIFLASMLELLGGDRVVVGVDVEIRPHNRAAIEEHPLAPRVRLVEGSSTEPATLSVVRDIVGPRAPVMVVLDSSHTHAHVARELELYSPLVEKESYLVVFDTAVEQMPAEAFPDRPWGPGDNPLTAVREFLSRNDRFVSDDAIDAKLLVSVAPGGYLRCIKD